MFALITGHDNLLSFVDPEFFSSYPDASLQLGKLSTVIDQF